MPPNCGIQQDGAPRSQGPEVQGRMLGPLFLPHPAAFLMVSLSPVEARFGEGEGSRRDPRSLKQGRQGGEVHISHGLHAADREHKIAARSGRGGAWPRAHQLQKPRRGGKGHSRPVGGWRVGEGDHELPTQRECSQSLGQVSSLGRRQRPNHKMGLPEVAHLPPTLAPSRSEGGKKRGQGPRRGGGQAGGADLAAMGEGLCHD